MNRIERKFFVWIFESSALVIAAAIGGYALDRLFGTRAQFLGLLLLGAVGLKVWQLIRLYRTSDSDGPKSDSNGGSADKRD